MASCSRTYCVVDAIDEMDGGNEEFMRKLVRLGQEKSSSIKLLVTSRPLPHIEQILFNPYIIQLPLRPQLVDRDIAIYIKERLHPTDFPSEAKVAVEEVLGKKSQGLFLYTRLMLDEILEAGFTGIETLQNTLEGLPNGLGDMYTKMLSDHSVRSGTPQDLQLFILKCVTHSSRPLRLLELSTLVDFVRKSPRTQFAPDLPPSTLSTKSIVRTACGPLLEILEDETVSIIHHSLTEYLTNPQEVGNLMEYTYIESKNAHLDIAKTCIDYLVSEGLSDWDTIKSKNTDQEINFNIARLTHPFLDYATKNWAYHALKCDKDDEDLFNLLDILLDSKSPVFAVYVEITDPKTTAKRTSALHIAAREGLACYTKHLLESGHDANFQDRKKRTPLHLAASNGFEKVADELAKHGAEKCKAEYAGYTPIHLAASANRKKVVRVLLKAGVSPLEPRPHDHPGNWCGNARHDTGVTPLQYACEYGHTETVLEFFPYLDDESLTKALLWALQYGKTSTATYIMENSKVDVNRVVNNETAIHIAAWRHDLVSVRNLLARGADIRSKIHDGYFYGSIGDHGPSLRSTPFQTFLQFAAGYPVEKKASPEDSFEILKVLVHAGCDLNEKDRGVQTAFHKILKGCQGMPAGICQEIIQYMFSNGADSSILTEDGSTALHLMPCHLERAFEALVTGGMDVNSRRKSDGRTPLFGAVGSEEHTSMFIKLGADCNIQDAKGDTPLHIAVQGLGYSTNVECNAAIKALLAAGADPNLKNKAGLAPIHTIKNFREHKEITLVLVAAGASLEDRTNAGCTVLLSCLRDRMFSERDMDTLLDLGADIHARDFAGKTVLHYSCEMYKALNSLSKLVEAGADPFLCDYTGNTLFHQAAREGPSYDAKEQFAFLEKLLELGVDPRTVNHAGQTPIHIAVGTRIGTSLGRIDPLNFFLGPKCSVDINFPDHLGIRAIHLAATLGERQVKQLLDKGADPVVVTLEGQTALHIAARSRQCNTVGLLTDFYLKHGKSEVIDKVDEEGRTALHYAVRSGRPESVAILVNIGGADLNAKDSKDITPLHMCAHIKQEDSHWTREFVIDQREAYIAAVGVTLKDPYRPAHYQYTEGRDTQSGAREIVKFLISHGAAVNQNSSSRRKGFHSRTTFLGYAISMESEVLVDELLDIEKNNLLPKSALEPKADQNDDEDEIYHWLYDQDLQRDAFQERYTSSRLQNTDYLEGLVNSGENNLGIFQELLSKDHEKGILKLRDLGADMLKPNSMGESCLTTLIKGGYATLLKHFGEEAREMNEEWIREIEKTDVNLPGRLSLPIFIACQRNLPNLEALKVLVGKFGVDVNVQISPKRFNSYDEGKTALHMLASCGQWWHTHALKYLLENGANPDIQDKDGDTPLHIAVKSSSDIAVSHLLSHSANPNLLNNAQLSPLTASKPSFSITKLLISHGADVSAGTKPFIFSCIEEGDLPSIRLLISMGSNLNIKLPPAEQHDLPSDDDLDVDRRRFRARVKAQNLEAAENSFPVHFAAGRKFNTAEKRPIMIPIIESLLEGGADPTLAFDDDGGSIIADLCVRGGILAPFLQLPALDLEARDYKGRTLLLCASTTDGNWDRHHVRSPTSDVSLLLERGANITAVDYEGRNVIYHLLTSYPGYKNIQFHHYSDLDTVLAHPLASQLVAQKDNNGTTSLQHALRMGQFQAIDALLAKGADPLEADGEGNTALHHLAAQASGADFIDYTYLSSLSEDQPNESADTGSPHHAKPSFITSLFYKFIKLGVDINARNKTGETCLFGFVGIKGIEVFNVKFFEEQGSDFTTVNVKGESLLHACAKGGEPPKPKYGGNEYRWPWIGARDMLLEKAKKVGYKGVSGKAGVFKWLMEIKSLDPLVEDMESRSALDAATASGCTGILELFRRKDD